MSEANHPHHENPTPAHGKHRKLHKDWRLWLIVGVMLGAMIIYVLTLDLR